jgi:arylsulfatase A-like enzyme
MKIVLNLPPSSNPQRSIRKGGYKLIVYPEVPTRRLYNLNEDPNELNDLAAVPEEAERMGSLMKELVILQAEMGDELRLE